MNRFLQGWTPIVVPALFCAQAVFCAVLAWSGDNFPLIILAVTSATTAIFLGFYMWLCRGALTSWGRAISQWAAAQEWGMKQDQILHETLQELAVYDDEAVEIHGGRATKAAFAYLEACEKEDE